MKNLKVKFKEKFGVNHTKEFFSPGRVNLIGEHTDYNGGNVFPCAIDRGTFALVKERDDNKFRMYSENFEDLGIIEFTLDKLENEKEHDWVNYPKGVIKMFLDAGYEVNKGFDVLFYGNIPNGAGLSSSASIEILTSVILKDLFNFNIDMIEMVKLCQKTENIFIGVNSGIMDQFAVGMGKKDHAILLDCNTLKYEYVPVVLNNELIVISNTNKELIKSEIRRKRVKHAVYENQRTLIAQKELSAGNISKFGDLMNESHISLRDDYEVTGLELDTLVELAWKQEGVIGSRMTGAGFGGCTVSIVKKDKVDDFIENIGKKYRERIGYEADFYVVEVSEGARIL